MLRLVFSPQWFLSTDILIDFFSFLVLLTFAIISLRYYRISRNKKLIYLGLAFLFIGLGELFKIIMNFGLYYNLPVTYRVGKMIVTSNIVKSIDLVYYAGFFLHRFLVMLGFYLIYYTSKKRKSRLEHLFILYFIMVSAIFTANAYPIFHITMALLITMIFINYLGIYQEKKSKNTKILLLAFLIFIISHLMMIFSGISGNVYIFANFLQLASYILLLYIIIRIYKHGKKK